LTPTESTKLSAPLAVSLLAIFDLLESVASVVLLGTGLEPARAPVLEPARAPVFGTAPDPPPPHAASATTDAVQHSAALKRHRFEFKFTSSFAARMQRTRTHAVPNSYRRGAHREQQIHAHVSVVSTALYGRVRAVATGRYCSTTGERAVLL
jgi:hypothetical protein